MKEILKEFILKYGTDSLFESNRLINFLVSKNTDLRSAYQVAMILKFGNVREYINRCAKVLTGVEVNNIITCCESGTNLNRETVKKHLYNILTALDISCTYETIMLPENTDGSLFDMEQSNDYVELAFCSSSDMKKDLALAESMIASGKNTEAVLLYTKLAKCGSTEAMYFLGLCYSEGKYGTVKSEKKGKDWLETAAKNGHPMAKVKLGDLYYNKKQYKNAYDMYCGAGAVSVNSEIKERIVRILNERRNNWDFVFFGGIILLAMWIFLFVVQSDMLLLGVGVTLVSSVLYAVILKTHIKQDNNSSVFAKLFAAMIFIWFIYPLVMFV